MKVYKGTDKDMKCRGFQFELGKTYEEGEAKLCSKGFHACEAPLDILRYYAPGNGCRYFVAELEDISPERGSDDSKVVGKKITLGAELDLFELTKAHVEWVDEHLDRSAVNTGYASSAVNTGYASSAVNSGNRSSAVNSGNASAAANSGSASLAVNTGYASSAVSSGSASLAVNTGYASSAVSSGSRSSAEVSGVGSIALGCGYNCKAKANVGSAICLCERGKWNGEMYPLLAVKAVIIDGEMYKPDTWYTLKNGEITEVEE